MITVDGGRLSPHDIAAVAAGEPVDLAEGALRRAGEAYDLAVRTAGVRPHDWCGSEQGRRGRPG
jgi:hypothetical protein